MWHIIGSSESETPCQDIIFDSLWAPKDGNKAVIGSGPRVIRIACVSDTHSRLKGLNVPEADVFVFAGDSVRHQDGEAEFQDFCEWIKRVPCREKFFVAGNHDHIVRDSKKRVSELMPGVTVLEDASATVGDTGLSIYGAPWTVGRNLFYLADAYEIPGDRVLKKWQQIPTGIDILVTHTPPWDVFDKTYKNKFIGSKYLRSEIANRIHPKIHIFGHNHDQCGAKLARFENGDECLFVNACVMFSRKPFLIEYHY